MNLGYSDYHLFGRSRVTPANIRSTLTGYDRFVSAFNTSSRVKTVFSEIDTPIKHWILFEEYRLSESDLPSEDLRHIALNADEAEAIQQYFDAYPISPGESICVDITGFIRPHLLFLLAFLVNSGLPKFDIVYSEPDSYQKGSQTKFSAEVREVRQVMAYEGSHNPEIEGEYLVVGCSYDSALMSAVANNRLQATKVQIFPFPALRPHMYQENRLRTELSNPAFGKVLTNYFAAGYDPFSTARALSDFYRDYKSRIRNLYLSPLATKPQVLGFGLFYLIECLSEPVSIIFPFSDEYNQETSVGISEVWRYEIDCELIRSLQK